MCPVDKEICLEILNRAIRVYPDPMHFSGSAKDFEKFDDPKFQEFANEHHILPRTKIKVWKIIFDTFGVEKE